MANRNYTHPNDIYNVIDNTFQSEKIEPAITGKVLLQPFFSKKGIDNIIRDFTDHDQTIIDYGYPDMNLYGQSYYHVLNWLSGRGATADAASSKGVVKGIRLTANNATFANSLVCLMLKKVTAQVKNEDGEPLYIDSETGEPTTVSTSNEPITEERLKTKIVLKQLQALQTSNKNSLLTQIISEYKEASTDTDQWKTIPLFLIKCLGRGAYGQYFRFRFVPAGKQGATSNRVFTYRNYYFEVYNDDPEVGAHKKIASLHCSTSPTAINSTRQSQFFEDIVDRTSDLPIEVIAYQDGIREAMADVYEVVSAPLTDAQKANLTTDNMDIISFVDPTLRSYSNVDIEEDSYNLGLLEGFPLTGGSDGDFAETVTPSMRRAAMEAKLIEFYKGNVDPVIYDRHECRFDTALDFNTSLEVKKAMRSWRDSENRDDFALRFDATTDQLDQASAIEFLEESCGEDFKKFSFSFDTQHFDTIDPYSNKRITVTPTYLVSLLYPAFAEHYGSQTPFAGLKVQLDNYILPGSLAPVYTSEDKKEEIYALGGNYIEKLAGHYVFGTNRTAQMAISDLDQLQNSLVYYEIKKDAKDLVANIRFMRNNNDNDLAVIQKLADSTFDKYRDTKVKAIEPEVLKDTTDETGRTAILKIKVGFNSIILNTEINVEITRA